MVIVVDASVVNKLFLADEENYLKTENIFERHVQKIDKILAPDLLFYEVANTLATKSYIPNRQVTKSLIDLEKYNLVVHQIAIGEIDGIAKFARKYKVSVYDASYAVLAQENNCDLITADGKFAKQVNLPFIKTLDSVS